MSIPPLLSKYFLQTFLLVLATGTLHYTIVAIRKLLAQQHI